MCDYSLHNVKARPARVGDRLTTRLFNMTTRGFSAPEDMNVAVCLLPGTELSSLARSCAYGLSLLSTIRPRSSVRSI